MYQEVPRPFCMLICYTKAWTVKTEFLTETWDSVYETSVSAWKLTQVRSLGVYKKRLAFKRGSPF